MASGECGFAPLDQPQHYQPEGLEPAQLRQELRLPDPGILCGATSAMERTVMTADRTSFRDCSAVMIAVRDKTHRSWLVILPNLQPDRWNFYLLDKYMIEALEAVEVGSTQAFRRRDEPISSEEG